MKIVIVTHVFTENDGQGRVNFEVVRAAALNGHEVHLLAERVAPELLALPGVRWTQISHGPLPSNLLRNAWFARSSARELARIGDWADITVANGAVTSHAVDVNAVHFVHNCWIASPYHDPGRGFRGLYRRFYAWLNARLELQAFAKARRIVAVSGIVAQELETIGVSANKIEVITNGVDTRTFDPAGSKAALPVAPGLVRALFVGDIVSNRKGLDTVLAALTGLDDVALVVVGRSENSPYPAQVKEAGLDDRVVFLSFRRDIPNIMRACDLFVFPSRYEPFGLVLLEAIASGLPVITAATCGASELIDDEACLKIANPNDVTALRTHLEALAADPARRTAMAERARAQALDLTWETMATRYLDCFARVLAEKRAHHVD